MNIIIIAITVLLCATWIFSSAFRQFVDGWKTRATLIVTTVLGVLEQVDPNLVTGALGIPPGTSQFFSVVLGLNVAALVFNEMRNGTQGAITKMAKK